MLVLRICRAIARLFTGFDYKRLGNGCAPMWVLIVSFQTWRGVVCTHWSRSGVALHLARRTLSPAWRHVHRAELLFRCCCQTRAGRLIEELPGLTCRPAHNLSQCGCSCVAALTCSLLAFKTAVCCNTFSGWVNLPVNLACHLLWCSQSGKAGIWC